MQANSGSTGQDPAAVKNATVVASVVSFALVIGGWAAIGAANDDAIDSVVAAQEVPLEEVPAVSAIVPKMSAPGSAAAARAASPSGPRAVPVAALYKAPVCAAPAKADGVATAKAVKAAGAAVATLGADFPEIYSGHTGCRDAGKLFVFRVPQDDFDEAVYEIAAREQVKVQLVKAPFSRQQLTEMNTWITEKRELWAARGVQIRSVANKPNGTIEVGVDPADVAAAAKRLAKYRAQVRVVPYVSSAS